MLSPLRLLLDIVELRAEGDQGLGVALFMTMVISQMRNVQELDDLREVIGGLSPLHPASRDGGGDLEIIIIGLKHRKFEFEKRFREELRN